MEPVHQYFFQVDCVGLLRAVRNSSAGRPEALTAAGSAVALAWLRSGLAGWGGTLVALAPKSVTAPVAMGIGERLGACRP